MPMLDQLLERKVRLIDYEKIADEKGNRLIAFGVFAGIAGAIDFLAGFGHYLLLAGYSTPFLNINYSYKYFELEDAYASIKIVSERLINKQIDESLRPLIFGITGRGRTAQGVLKVLGNFKTKTIHPDVMEKLVANPKDPAHATTIYLTTINTEDVTVPRDESRTFDKDHYYKNPSEYKNVFSKKYLPYISCLFHCIFWDTKYPRYIKNKHLKKLANSNRLRLFGICDVTCDADGSIECLKKFTSPDRPFFFYDADTEEESYYFEYKKNRIMYLALDYLPSELSYDASTRFVTQLCTSRVSSRSGFQTFAIATRASRWHSRVCFQSWSEQSLHSTVSSLPTSSTLSVFAKVAKN
ncbi:MAG: hypothetical protein JST59_01975 [Actinobacteria bacterium]|nr:hypothetical protein [Actinomycetota bacterium]